MMRSIIILIFIHNLFNGLSQSTDSLFLKNEPKIFYGSSVSDAKTVSFFTEILDIYEKEYERTGFLIEIGIPNNLIFKLGKEGKNLNEYFELKNCDSLYSDFLIRLIEKSKINNKIVLLGLNDKVHFSEFVTISKFYGSIVDSTSLECIKRVMNNEFGHEASISDSIKIENLYNNILRSEFESEWDYKYMKGRLHQLLYEEVYVDSMDVLTFESNRAKLISLSSTYTKDNTINIYGKKIQAISVVMASEYVQLEKDCMTKIIRNKHYEENNPGLYLQYSPKFYTFSPKKGKYIKIKKSPGTYLFYSSRKM